MTLNLEHALLHSPQRAFKKRFSYGCQALHSSREETLKESLQYPGILSSFMKSLRGRKHRKTMSKSDFFLKIKSNPQAKSPQKSAPLSDPGCIALTGSDRHLGASTRRGQRSPKRLHQTHGPLLRRVFRRSRHICRGIKQICFSQNGQIWPVPSGKLT